MVKAEIICRKVRGASNWLKLAHIASPEIAWLHCLKKERIRKSFNSIFGV